MIRDEAAREAFVRGHTALAAVPLVPEIRVHTVTEVTPLWQATEAWLGRRGVAIPFWSVPWAGGQALARFLLDAPEHVRGAHVVDLGSGGGLVAVAAALAGAAHVLAADIDPVALTATRLAAEANGVAGAISLTSEDLTAGASPPPDLERASVVLAGDVWYEREQAARFDVLLRGLAGRGQLVLTGDPGRAYVPQDLRELARHEVPTPWELESTASRTTRVLAFPAARRNA